VGGNGHKYVRTRYLAGWGRKEKGPRDRCKTTLGINTSGQFTCKGYASGSGKAGKGGATAGVSVLGANSTTKRGELARRERSGQFLNRTPSTARTGITDRNGGNVRKKKSLSKKGRVVARGPLEKKIDEGRSLASRPKRGPGVWTKEGRGRIPFRDPAFGDWEVRGKARVEGVDRAKGDKAEEHQ